MSEARASFLPAGAKRTRPPTRLLGDQLREMDREARLGPESVPYRRCCAQAGGVEMNYT